MRVPYTRVVAREWPTLQEPPSWQGRSLEERDAAIVAACRGAMQILAGQPDREERLRRQAPVPTSTRALLRRLVRRADG